MGGDPVRRECVWTESGFGVSTGADLGNGPQSGIVVHADGDDTSVGKGALVVRATVSLEPATVRNQYYPLLFQTGDAAMGAVAFPHRASAMETPQATLGHHWLDATHIVNKLATVGVNWSKLRFEASGFRGREPNENRWNIDTGGMDSWSTRVVYQPAFRWLAQASDSRITSPETLHHGDVQRTTASVQYTRPLENGTGWSSSPDDSNGPSATSCSPTITTHAPSTWLPTPAATPVN